MKLRVVKLGVIEYQEALSLQQSLLALRQQEVIEDILLLLEHPSVITLGVSGKESNILADEEFLKSKGVSVYRTNRGGDVTYHGPGQIVGYPIINLNYHGKDVKDYIWRLEETFIRLLREEYKLKAERSCRNNGVWVENDKITAIGCAAKRWVTMHGFAFNINTNLDHYLWINPCGITDRGVTSLEKLLAGPQDIAVIEHQIIKHFSALFNFEPNFIERNDFMKEIEAMQYVSTKIG